MQYSFRSSRIALFAACLAIPVSVGFYSAPAAFAQGITTGGISGSVVDQAGAVIPFAKVTIVNNATGAKYEQTVQGNGDFSLLNLPLGVYTVSVGASGFTDLKVDNVNVTIGVLAIGKETLNAGGGSTTIEASAVAPLLSTEQSQLSITLDSEAISNLPFNGGFDTVALLQPGVSITHDNSFSNSNGSYGGFSSQGQRGRSNNFEIDGQSNNDNSVAGPQVFFSNQDALAGVEVITNNFSAEYGRNAGSVVNYLTKSGTNQYHGSAFEFYEGNWAESFAQGQKSPFLGYCAPGEDVTDGCAVPALPRYVDNKFGGTFGGPFPGMKDKMWYFGSALFDRYRNGGGTSLSGPTGVTPTPNGLTQLQAAFPNDPGVAALVNNGPYSIKTGNPRVVGTPVNLPVGPNGTLIEFSEIGRSVPSLYNDEEILGRIDWQATAKDHVFLRYFYQDDPYLNAGGTVYAGNWYNVPDTAHSIGADWSHTLTPTIVNQIRYSFQQTSILFQGGAQPNCVATSPEDCTASIGISGHLTDPSNENSPSYSMVGFGYATNIPQGRTVKVTQVQDNVTWTKGKQTILFGGEWDYQNSPNPFLPDYNGGFSFSSFNNFLTGTTGSFTLGNGNNFTTKFTEFDLAAYFQDDYKITSSLTLNLGMRWEFDSQAVNLLHDETLSRESNPATAFWDQSLPIADRTIAKQPNNLKEFQPRFGFAFNPSFDKRLVVRGGFSINFDPAFYNLFLNVATAAPVVNLGSIKGCGTTIQCLPSTGASGAEVRALDLPYIPVGAGINPGLRNETIVAPNFHNPYTESFLLGMSHQVGNHAVLEMDYVGNHQVGNFMSINANPLLTQVQGPFPSFADVSLCTDTTQPGYGHPDCARTNVRARNNGAFGIFNALEAKFTTHAFHGLSSNTSFTYGKTIDNTSEVFGTFAGGNTIAFAENPVNPNGPERGVSGDSEKFVAASNFSFMLPKFHNGSGLFGRALSGYRLDTIWTFNTGQPVTPYQYGYAGTMPTLETYSDPNFLNWQLSGYDNARPILNNPKAPATSVGVYDDGAYTVDDMGNKTYDLCGPAGYYNWANCAAGSQSDFRWVRNSQVLANAANNPYIGVGRNTLRTQYWNNFDVSLQKETKISERVLMTIALNAYNAMNRQFLGTPDTGVDDVGSSFEDFRYNYGSNRNAQLKIDISF